MMYVVYIYDNTRLEVDTYNICTYHSVLVLYKHIHILLLTYIISVDDENNNYNIMYMLKYMIYIVHMYTNALVATYM